MAFWGLQREKEGEICENDSNKGKRHAWKKTSLGKLVGGSSKKKKGILRGGNPSSRGDGKISRKDRVGCREGGEWGGLSEKKNTPCGENRLVVSAVGGEGKQGNRDRIRYAMVGGGRGVSQKEKKKKGGDIQ